MNKLGFSISHLDSHQHLHMFPGLWNITLQLSNKYNIPIIRIPAEKFHLRPFSFTRQALQLIAHARCNFKPIFIGYNCAMHFSLEKILKQLEYFSNLKFPTEIEIGLHPNLIKPGDSLYEIKKLHDYLTVHKFCRWRK